MTMKHNDSNRTRSIMSLVTNGMHVHDVNDDHIGKVEDLYFGADADDPQAHGAGAATTGTPRTTVAEGLVADIAQGLFGDDAIPDTVRNRFLNEGFIQIEPGTLLGADMFATPDQIAGVTEGAVRLKVTRDQLFHK